MRKGNALTTGGSRGYDREPSLQYLRQTLEEARKGMPEPLEGCRVCHYLYGI
ncbi:MAG: hypothetical protein AB2L13_19530 [Spirochaetota bacterium]